MRKAHKKKTKFCTITLQEETEVATSNLEKIWVHNLPLKKFHWEPKNKRRKARRKKSVHLSHMKNSELNQSQNSISRTTTR